MFRIIEEDEPEAATEDNAERGPEEKVVEVAGLDATGRIFCEITAIAPAEHQAGNIGQGVPADLDRPQAEGRRIEVGKGQGGNQDVGHRINSAQ